MESIVFASSSDGLLPLLIRDGEGYRCASCFFSGGGSEPILSSNDFFTHIYEEHPEQLKYLLTKTSPIDGCGFFESGRSHRGGGVVGG